MSIKVENVFYSYLKKTPNKVEALNDISLEINSGDFIAIVGHTGSGKSTLIQHLNGLLLPDKGRLIIDDFIVNPKKNKKIKDLRKHVGVVFQFPEYQLFEETVEKDVAFGPRNFGASKEEAIQKARKALASVGLDESFYDRSPFNLSGGEKRRIAIAGILAIEPDVLVLDEPTAGLDPLGQEEIMNLLVKMNKEGKTIVLVTHDMDLVMKYTNKVFVLKDGRIAYQGEPSQLFVSEIEDLSIEIPKLFEFALELNKRGYHIDIKNIKSVDDIVLAISKENLNG